TVLKLMARDRGLATASLWAGIPHYVGDPPCPKATLALLSCLEDITGLTIDPADLIEMSAAWQHGAEGLVSYDLDLAEYVRELESEREQVDHPEATGDAIARECERYLRRRKDQSVTSTPNRASIAAATSPGALLSVPVCCVQASTARSARGVSRSSLKAARTSSMTACAGPAAGRATAARHRSRRFCPWSRLESNHSQSLR